MEIRKAHMSELDRIEAVYAAARAFMARTGNPNQWGNSHPDRAFLAEDIRNGNLHVVIAEGEICGAFAFFPGEDPTYGYIEGNWHFAEPYAAIHSVASNGKQKGIFTEILKFCEAKCNHLRIDTHEDNRVMQHVVTKHGFSYCGIIYLENGNPRLAYDRKKLR